MGLPPCSRAGRLRGALGLGIIAAVVALPTAADAGRSNPSAAPRPGPDPEPGFVGDATCRGCHSVEAAHWDDTVHARAFANAPGAAGRHGCENCHGPGGAHIASPDDLTRIIAFTRASPASVESRNEMCLQCHAAGPLIHWMGSLHESQELACSDCHNPMARTSARGLLRERSISETCFSCHPAQRAEFRKRSHMPLLEGKLSCIDCHAPHGSNTDPLIAGDSVNQVCYACHAEKRGPFLFEHEPVSDNCTHCHRPHGSNHERLLSTARPFLCQECHSPIDDPQLSHPAGLLLPNNSASGAFPDERLMNRSCTNCHVRIHGSNHPGGAFFHR